MSRSAGVAQHAQFACGRTFGILARPRSVAALRTDRVPGPSSVAAWSHRCPGHLFLCGFSGKVAVITAANWSSKRTDGWKLGNKLITAAAGRLTQALGRRNVHAIRFRNPELQSQLLAGLKQAGLE
jgi:hypothetical protein